MNINANDLTLSIIANPQKNDTSQAVVRDQQLIEPKSQGIVVADTPAVLVQLSPTKAAALPDIYDEPKVDVVQVRNTNNTGAAATRFSSQLINELTSIRARKSTFSSASFFSQIGALSRETSEYRNEARGLTLGASKVTDKTKIDFDSGRGRPQESVTMRIKTKDGDLIDVKLQRNSGGSGDSIEFSFVVTGKLSAEEQDALEKLSNKLGEVADDFFRLGNTSLHGLKEFDNSVLEGFNIEFSKPKGDSYAVMKYDYSVDTAAQTQHLVASDAEGFGVDITSDLQSLLGATTAAGNNSLKLYLDLIRKAFNEHSPVGEDSNRLNKQFVIDAFSSMVIPLAENATAATSGDSQKMLDAFNSGLPDFTASIHAPLYQNYKNYLMPQALQLNLSQTTEMESRDDGSLLVKQVNTYERHSSALEGIVGSDKGDVDTGNYVYRVIHEKQQTLRILDLGQDGLNNLVTEQTKEVEDTASTYRNFQLQDTKTEHTQKRQLTQLADDIEKHKQQKQTFNSLYAISENTKRIFTLEDEKAETQTRLNKRT
jgi:hypothetical protein